MALQFVFGPSGSGKSTYVQKLVTSEAALHRDRDYLMIVPDQFTMQTQKIMASSNPRGGILNIDVLSFGRLTHRIFEEVGKPERILLNDLGKCLILRRVIQDKEGELRVLKRGIHSPGYVAEVKSVLSEFMQYGIHPSTLDGLISDSSLAPTLRYKLEDFGVLYSAFLDALSEKYTTSEETLYILMERIPLSKLLKRSVLVFDGFTGFTPIQTEVIQTLLVHAQDVIVTLPLGAGGTTVPAGVGGTVSVGADSAVAVPDGQADFSDLFYLTYKNAADLSRAASEIHVPVADPVILSESHRFENAPSVAYLERNLFRKHEADYPDNPAEITVTKAKDEEHECRILCRQIRELIANKGYHYRDMAVVCGDLGTYSEVIKMQFEKYDIPYFCDATTELTKNPFVNYLRSILDVMLENYSYRDCGALLKSAFSGFSEEDSDFIDNFLLAKNIRGRNLWHKEFTSLSRELNRSFNGLSKEVKAEKRKETLDRLNALRNRFIEITEPLEVLKEEQGGKRATAKEWLTALYRILLAEHAEVKLSAMADIFDAEGEAGKALEYRQVYKEVMNLFDQIVSLIGEEEITLEELAEVLDTGFAEIRIGIVPKGVDTLPVCDMIRSRFGDIKVLFFLGVNEGNIPRVSTSGGLISDMERSVLLGNGMDMAPDRARESFVEQLYLYQTMTKPSEHLYISFLSVTTSGDSKKPSYLIAELKKLYPGLKIRDEVLDIISLEGKNFADILEKHNVLSGKDLQNEFAMYLGNALSGVPSGDAFNVPSEEQSEASGKERMTGTGYLKQLYAALKADPASSQWLSEITDRAFASYKPTDLEESLAKELYGNIMNCSVSSLEKYAGCAYAHFLNYGLGLREREIAGIESTDLGNITHEALEGFGKYCLAHNEEFAEVSRERAGEIIDAVTDELIAKYEDGIFADATENPFLADRMKRILHRSVEVLKLHLSKGDFKPVAYEQEFQRLLVKDDTMLVGKIDRIDTCADADATFVKIVDYKSGSRNFEEKLFHAGVQLQTAVYLSEAIKKFQTDHPETDYRPAAMFYFRMQDPILPTTSEESEDIENERNIALRPTGILSGNETNMEHLEREPVVGKSPVIPITRKQDLTLAARGNSAVRPEDGMLNFLKEADETVMKLSGEIRSGKIDLSPLAFGDYDACEFCDYKTACGFDVRLPGFAKRLPDGEKPASDDDTDE